MLFGLEFCTWISALGKTRQALASSESIIKAWKNIQAS